MGKVIELQGLNVFYGQIQALFDAFFELLEGEIVAVIGANGAGKSTLLRTIAGLNKYSGELKIFEQTRRGFPAESIARLGVILVPEGRRIFPGLTVVENLRVPTAMHRMSTTEAQNMMEQVFSLFPKLRVKSKSLGWTLSGGEQQMLAIGRALMARPKVLMLDEPSLGLAPNIVDELYEVIPLINRDGASVILVEQNAYLALEIANRAYVLESGRVGASGPAETLLDSDAVRRSYLGGV